MLVYHNVVDRSTKKFSCSREGYAYFNRPWEFSPGVSAIRMCRIIHIGLKLDYKITY